MKRESNLTHVYSDLIDKVWKYYVRIIALETAEFPHGISVNNKMFDTLKEAEDYADLIDSYLTQIIKSYNKMTSEEHNQKLQETAQHNFQRVTLLGEMLKKLIEEAKNEKALFEESPFNKPYSSRERSLFITKLEEAKHWLAEDVISVVHSLKDFGVDFIEEAAKEAYRKYGDKAEWKNFQGNPMLSWEDLPENTKDNWRAVVS